MKKVLLLTIAVLICGFSQRSHAQVGLKASFLTGMLYGESEIQNGEDIQEVDPGFGFHAGIFFRAGEAVVSFQGELLYEARKSISEVEYDLVGVGVTGRSEISMSYISLPLLAVINLGNFKPYVGVNVAYLLSAKGTRTVTAAAVTKETDINFKKYGEENNVKDYERNSYFNPLEVGVNAGIMFQLSDAFHIDLRLQHSINDLTNNEYDKSYLNPLESREDSDKFLNISLGVGLAF